MKIANIKIALVDDSQAILLMLKASLNEMGFKKVDCFRSGIPALDAISIKKNHYDAIFIDLNMPEMDGMTLIKKLGQIEFGGAVIIISEMDKKVISLASELAQKSQTRIIGNIPKPITQDKLSMIFEKLNNFLLANDNIFTCLTEAELLEAISKNQITPYYQPKIDSKTNKVCSVEVLARIVKPGNHEVIQPISFISTAERCDLMNILTFQLFEKAAKDHKKLVKTFDNDFKIAINLSATQLSDLECPDKLITILNIHNIKPENIILEITEENAITHFEQLETLNRLRIRGFGLSIDDFGTGFTNLNQLRTLPFTEIKVDRSLIYQIHKDTFSQTIVSTLVNLTEKQGLDIVAEGIESFDELEYLQCYKKNILLQGFLICKPKPIEEIIHWHRFWAKSTIA